MAQTFDTVPHVLLAAHGPMVGGESWSCGLRTTLVPADVPQADLQTVANTAANAWQAFSVTINAGFAPTTLLSGVTARSLDARGITTTLAEGTSTTHDPSSGAAGKMPNQCAVAVTLLTARAGRTGKGRFFLPSTNFVLESGVLSVTTVTALKAEVKTLIDAINTALVALSGSPKVAVQSKSGPTNAGEGYTGAAVTAISIGNVVDTQRRRRASIVEARQLVAIA